MAVAAAPPPPARWRSRTGGAAAPPRGAGGTGAEALRLLLVQVLVLLDGASMVPLPCGKRSYLELIVLYYVCFACSVSCSAVDGAGVRSPGTEDGGGGGEECARAQQARSVWAVGVGSGDQRCGAGRREREGHDGLVETGEREVRGGW